MEQIAQEPRDDVLGPDAVPEALARADIVIILVPLNPRHLRHRRRALPGPDAGPRAPIIDTAALLAELTSGRLRAALDVTDSGPLPAGTRYGRARLLTLHVASANTLSTERPGPGPRPADPLRRRQLLRNTVGKEGF